MPAALGLAVALDLAFAEPPRRLHPVARFGSVVARFDRSWSRPRLVGVIVAAALPLGAAAVAGGFVASVTTLGTRAGGGSSTGAIPILAVLVAGLLLFSVVSLRMLLDVTAEVVELTATDPAAARESVRALVGRDAADLSPAELRSAAVESAAENLADGFVAPLGGFVVGATAALTFTSAPVLPLGVAVAVWVKAVNTLDSMLGYRSKPVGWASARLDDAVMYLPARATALSLAIAARSPGALRDARNWARTPSSPNSGWPMATAATALAVRLEKPDHYALNPDAAAPGVADARDAVRLVGVAGGVAAAIAGGSVLAVSLAVSLSAGSSLSALLSAATEVIGWR
nr:CobD/CbiB family cobalamin biosynthesis protein [Halorubrum aidingense]